MKTEDESRFRLNPVRPVLMQDTGEDYLGQARGRACCGSTLSLKGRGDVSFWGRVWRLGQGPFAIHTAKCRLTNLSFKSTFFPRATILPLSINEDAGPRAGRTSVSVRPGWREALFASVLSYYCACRVSSDGADLAPRLSRPPRPSSPHANRPAAGGSGTTTEKDARSQRPS